MTLDQLKSYHSERPDALCPGHPEIEHEGIELTTGPLGQGIANAVGLAIATKHLAATYNKPSYEVVNNHTWCMIGDACLQEGVALEAISFAGHLKLDNLTVMYDNNQVTCDGSVDLTNTEDVNAKMRACGWDVIDVEDGCFAVENLIDALHRARNTKSGKPTFINIRTIIGVDSAVAGKAAAHGAAFGVENVAKMKESYGLDPKELYSISQDTKRFFEDIPAKGEKLVTDWKNLVAEYSEKFPELAVEFKRRMSGKLPENWKDNIPASFPTSATPSRKSAGLAFNPVAKAVNSFMVGTADLSPSVNMIWPGKLDFQHVSYFTNPLDIDLYTNSLLSPISKPNVVSMAIIRAVIFTTVSVSMPWLPFPMVWLHFRHKP
jgi:dihydroxyacetone synthase